MLPPSNARLPTRRQLEHFADFLDHSKQGPYSQNLLVRWCCRARFGLTKHGCGHIILEWMRKPAIVKSPILRVALAHATLQQAQPQDGDEVESVLLPGQKARWRTDTHTHVETHTHA